MPLWHIFWAVGTWKHSKCKEEISLNFLLPKDRSSKRYSIVIEHLHRSFIRLVTEEYKSVPHSDKLWHKLSYLLSVLLMVHSSFLKNHLLFLKGPTYSSSFLIKMVFNSKFSATLESYSFFYWAPPTYIWGIYVKLLFVFLLLICLLVQGFQLRTQRGIGKIIFPKILIRER